MNKNIMYIIFPQKNRGAAIIIVLIFVALMSVLGVTAAKISMLSSQSTRYQRDFQIAYEAAQAAIADAIMDIETGSRNQMFIAGAAAYYVNGEGCHQSAPGYNTKGICYYENFSQINAAYEVDFVSGTDTVGYGEFTGRNFSSGSVGLKPALPPRYIIEILDSPVDSSSVSVIQSGKPLPPIYRITAMGFGPATSVYAVVQVNYRKGF